MTCVLIKTRKFGHRQRHKPIEDRGRDFSVAFTNHEMPGTARNQQKLEELRKDPLLDSSERAWPV